MAPLAAVDLHVRVKARFGESIGELTGTRRDAPVVPSVASIWNHAEWQEREVFDLLGVTFERHPDLRRILMPEDWPGHPLRKDFVEPEEWHGISTSRASLLKP